MRMRFALIAALLLCATGAARAKTYMDVEAGWGDEVRMGRWIPVQVTLDDPSSPSVVVEIAAPPMRVRQYVGAIGPIPKSFVLYVPLNTYINYYSDDSLSVLVRDASSGKLLARTREDDGGPPPFSNVQMIDAQGQLIGVTGGRTSLQNLRAAVLTNRLYAGYLEPAALPFAAKGYDSIDLLVINGLDVTDLLPEQQRALLDWISSGGKLIVWPGTDPLPREGLLVDALPCTVGGASVITLLPKFLKDHSLPARFATLTARELTARPGSEPVQLFSSTAKGYRRQLGLGRIVVLPTDFGEFQTFMPHGVLDIWQTALAGMLDLPLLEGAAGVGSYNGINAAGQRQAMAEQRVADLLGDVPGAGQFGFSYVAIVLIGLMVVVGPVDWLVLRALKRQAWTWVTTSGWIALVTLGALYVGHVFKSGDLHYRTFAIVDQAGSETVARVDYTGLYSPRTADYEIQTDPTGWAEPLSGMNGYYGNQRGLTEVAFSQTYHGNVPSPMPINVWSLRFLKSESLGIGPAVIEAKVKQERPAGTLRAKGQIRNLGERPLRNIQIIAPAGSCDLPANVVVAPGETTLFDIELPRARQSTKDRQANSPVYNYPYGPGPRDQVMTPSTPVGIASELAAERTELFDAALDAGKHALIIAEEVDPPAAATLADQKAIEKHFRVIRALVPLEE